MLESLFPYKKLGEVKDWLVMLKKAEKLISVKSAVHKGKVRHNVTATDSTKSFSLHPSDDFCVLFLKFEEGEEMTDTVITKKDYEDLLSFIWSL